MTNQLARCEACGQWVSGQQLRRANVSLALGVEPPFPLDHNWRPLACSPCRGVSKPKKGSAP